MLYPQFPHMPMPRPHNAGRIRKPQRRALFFEQPDDGDNILLLFEREVGPPVAEVIRKLDIPTQNPLCSQVHIRCKGHPFCNH